MPSTGDRYKRNDESALHQRFSSALCTPLAISDFCLFGRLKKELQGLTIGSKEDVLE
jgi:hypothetical protein